MSLDKALQYILAEAKYPNLSADGEKYVHQLADFPAELDDILFDMLQYKLHMNRQYESQQLQYLSLVQILVEYLGGALIVRESFEKLCQKIFNGRSEYPSKILRLADFVRLKMHPIDQSESSLQKVFNHISSQPQSVIYNPQPQIRTQQQPFDYIFVSLLLIKHEIQRRLGPPTNNRPGFSMKQNINQFLKEITTKGGLTLFKSIEEIKQGDPLQQLSHLEEVINKILSGNELKENNVTRIQQEALMKQKREIQELKTYLKEVDNKNQVEEQLNIWERPFFRHMQKVLEDENQSIEYKDYVWPFDDEKEKIVLEVISSFLNTNGGYLFFGIRDFDKQVKGIKLTLKERDEFKLKILQLVLEIHPKVEMVHNALVQVTFIPVKKEDETIPGLFVVRVTIQQGETNRCYQIKDGKGGFMACLRMDGRVQRVWQPQLSDYIFQISQKPREKAGQKKVAPHDKIVDIIQNKPPFTPKKVEQKEEAKGNTNQKHPSNRNMSSDAPKKYQGQESPKSDKKPLKPKQQQEQGHKPEKQNARCKSSDVPKMLWFGLFFFDKSKTDQLRQLLSNLLRQIHVDGQVLEGGKSFILVQFNQDWQIDKFASLLNSRRDIMKEFSFKGKQAIIGGVMSNIISVKGVATASDELNQLGIDQKQFKIQGDQIICNSIEVCEEIYYKLAKSIYMKKLPAKIEWQMQKKCVDLQFEEIQNYSLYFGLFSFDRNKAEELRQLISNLLKDSKLNGEVLEGRKNFILIHFNQDRQIADFASLLNSRKEEMKEYNFNDRPAMIGGVMSNIISVKGMASAELSQELNHLGIDQKQFIIEGHRIICKSIEDSVQIYQALGESMLQKKLQVTIQWQIQNKSVDFRG